MPFGGTFQLRGHRAEPLMSYCEPSNKYVKNKACWRLAAMKYFIRERKASGSSFLSSISLLSLLPSVPTMETLALARPISCLDPCHLLLPGLLLPPDSTLVPETMPLLPFNLEGLLGFALSLCGERELWDCLSFHSSGSCHPFFPNFGFCLLFFPTLPLKAKAHSDFFTSCFCFFLFCVLNINQFLCLWKLKATYNPLSPLFPPALGDDSEALAESSRRLTWKELPSCKHLLGNPVIQ